MKLPRRIKKQFKTLARKCQKGQATEHEFKKVERAELTFLQKRAKSPRQRSAIFLLNKTVFQALRMVNEMGKNPKDIQHIVNVALGIANVKVNAVQGGISHKDIEVEGGELYQDKETSALYQKDNEVSKITNAENEPIGKVGDVFESKEFYNKANKFWHLSQFQNKDIS